MPATYADGKTKARIGDVVMAPGKIRGIVIEIDSAGFVKVLAIGTDKNGDTYVLASRFVGHYPASDCTYLEKQLLNL